MPSATLRVGTVTVEKGRLTYGSLPGVDLPSGFNDRLALVVACGTADGPTLWLTANIHGNEVAGVIAAQRFLAALDCRRLRGTVVCVPSLNPAGLRTGRREPYVDERDPNRTFPGARRRDDERRAPSAFERLAASLYEMMRADGDYYIDLHCSTLRSTPFTIRDRVLYRTESSVAAAHALSERLDAMIAAFGFPSITDFRAPSYVAKELHRSTTGAFLQGLNKPGITVELGPHTIVDARAVDAAVVGLRNVLRWADMLDGAAEPMPALPAPRIAGPLRREDAPIAQAAGILDYAVGPGDTIAAGDVVAVVRDMWGRPVGDGVVRSETDAFVLGLEDGVLAYPGAPIAHMAIPDDAPMMEVWPS